MDPLLEKLKTKISESTVGIELWFSKYEFDNLKEKTFEEWFAELLERY